MEFEGQGSSRSYVLSRMSVFDIWHKQKTTKCRAERTRQVFEEVLQSIVVPDGDKENFCFDKLRSRITYFCEKFSVMWKKHDRSRDRVREYEKAWLNVSETVPLDAFCRPSASTEATAAAEHTESRRGRPRKAYGECSERTRQRRRKELSELDESMASALSDSFSAGLDVSFCGTPAAPNEVVSLLVEAKLTKHQYIVIKDFVNSKLPFSLLPSYKSVLSEKQHCYPVADKITVTESCAEVELQALLDHTASRILESQKEVLNSLPADDSSNLCLIGKWGFDGTTGQSEYKQAFSDSNTDGDSNLFVTSYVPLQLLKKTDQEDVVIWKNPRPSSTRYCRPIRFQYKKETSQVSVEEERYFSEKINALQPTTWTLDNRSWSVSHNLQLTMVDGKVCNALSETSSTKCYICEATPKQMNDLDSCVQRAVNQDRFAFGLSPLHAWIRFFEFFLHVSYRLPIQKWQVRGEADKTCVANRKSAIQTQFREKLGLIVDKPKPGGSGTSNDGNTARKFFENPDISSEITGVDKNLIERCATILKALGSGYKINASKFGEFAMETAKQIVQTYPWFYMPASVHKVLVHGSAIIDHALLSIGELSEEAAEARNKDIKTFRLRHTRKFSRSVTNRDLLNRLFLSSDPLITGLRKLPRKKKGILSKAVLDLLSF